LVGFSRFRIPQRSGRRLGLLRRESLSGAIATPAWRPLRTRSEVVAVGAIILSHRASARRHRRLRTLASVTCLGVVAGLILAAWRPRPAAREPPPGAGARVQHPASAEPVGAVDPDDLLKAGSNDANWLMYGRTYDAHRYSPLKQIDATNVSRLLP